MDYEKFFKESDKLQLN